MTMKRINSYIILIINIRLCLDTSMGHSLFHTSNEMSCNKDVGHANIFIYRYVL